MNDKEILSTDRMYLREFTLADADAVFEFNSEPEVTRYTGDADAVKTRQDAEKIISEIWLKEYQQYGYGRWAIVLKETDRVIGFCGFKYIESLAMPDLGYRLLPDYWGVGLATEIAQATLAYGKRVMALENAFADAMPDNIASNKILEKLGFTFSQQVVEHDQLYNRYLINLM